MGAIAEDVKRSGTLAQLNDVLAINQPGTATVAVNLVITGSNTTVFEATVDEGTSPTWVAINAINVNTGIVVASATASGLFKVEASGYRQVRVRCSTYVSGSIVATLNASVAHASSGVIGMAATPISIPGTISAVNSSTTPLAGGATFTGTGEDVSTYAAVTVMVATDQVSGGVGVSLQWSEDNTNWDVKQNCGVTSFTVTGGSAPGVVVTNPVLARYFRLVYTNGATPQTLFRAQTIYHATAPPYSPASTTSQGVRPAGSAPMVWDSTNDIFGPIRSFGAQPDNAGGSTALTTGIIALNASSLPDRVRTANGADGTTGTGLLGAAPMLWDGAAFRKAPGSTAAGAVVQGAAAAGAAAAGNPVMVGVSDGVNAQNARQAPTLGSQGTSVGAAYAMPALWSSSGNAVPQSTAAAAGDGNNGTSYPGSAPMLMNGATRDSQRNNTTTVVQASTLTTAQTINTDIVNYNGRAFMAHANVTIYNGGTFLMKLQWKDANGLFVDIPGATTGALASGADVILNVGPTVWPANTATVFSVNWFVPRQIRLVTVIATASVTFSQSYDLPAN